MNKENPFALPKKLCASFFKTKYKYIELLHENWENEALSISSYEETETEYVEPKDEDFWIVEVSTDGMTDPEYFLKLLPDYIEISFIKQDEVPDLDWLQLVASQNTEIELHPFLIAADKSKKRNRFFINIEAARAFGSGEHATTKLCLKAIQNLSKIRSFNSILDLGSGSGILAMAARLKSMSKTNIIATDIDEVAVEVAKNNFKQNNLANEIKALTVNGYDHKNMNGEKFDLIIANILARPLIYLSKQTFEHLNDSGYLVVSGIVKNQERQVLNAHLRFGMRLVEAIRQDHWSCLIMQRRTCCNY